jgi:hypothetical protein
MPLVIVHTGAPGPTAISFQQVTASTTALALVFPEGAIPKRVWLTVHTNAIRYRYDENDPTTTSGHRLANTGAPLELIGSQAIQAFRMIRDASADAEVAYTVEV